MKYLFILAIGVAIGYGYGFKDARKNDENVVTRLVNRVGGDNRGKYRTDIDKQMQSVER